MFLNKSLSDVLCLTQDKSVDAFNAITNFLNSSPTGESIQYTTSKDISLQTTGSYMGESGYWFISAGLDDAGNIEKLHATFKGDKSSRKPYSHTTQLSLVSPSSSFPQFMKEMLVDFRTTRTFNYRYVDREKRNLTSSDIMRMQEPISISNFSLSLGRNKRSGKLELTSSESYEQQAEDIAFF